MRGKVCSLWGSGKIRIWGTNHKSIHILIPSVIEADGGVHDTGLRQNALVIGTRHHYDMA